MESFVKLPPEQITDNPFSAIGRDWMLITAGTVGDCNAMTASWGGFGVLWGRPVAICFIRPDRYTFEFAARSDRFSFCFFDRQFRDALDYCGTHSGRDVDKIRECGLHPFDADGTIGYHEARLIIGCRKIYSSDFTGEGFVDPALDKSIYKTAPRHRQFIGEITTVLSRTPGTTS